eukprot:TRINITY_DN85391_c0_g1_i1.p1 TRINITY_DN85391_c0_g1~~TRINITY_DN85391_c0_g1_i1.p1  ORF type:complete len:353 (-),score=55.88 TRINITY_DN85391_c0_g1_i1:155-1213(-)
MARLQSFISAILALAILELLATLELSIFSAYTGDTLDNSEATSFDEGIDDDLEGLEVILLQTQLKRSRRHDAKSDAAKDVKVLGATATEESLPSPVSSKEIETAKYWVDHEPTLDGCGAASKNPDDFLAPISEVFPRLEAAAKKEGKPTPDLICYFGGPLTSCAVSHTKKDFMEFSGTWPSGIAATEGLNNPKGFSDGAMSTAPGVFEYDSEICVKAGWLDIPKVEQERLLNNYSAVQERAKEDCRPHAELSKTISAKDFFETVQDAEKEHFAAIVRNTNNVSMTERPAFMKDQYFKNTMAYNCAVGLADCFLHWCMYNFCFLSDGRVGMAHQCRPDWHMKEVPSTIDTKSP